MELKRYGAVLWRRKWLVVGIVGLALAATWALAGPERWRPRYRAAATLLVVTPAGQPVAYPVDAVRTVSVARDAVRAAGVTQDPATVVANLTVEPRPGTSLVSIRVESSDAASVARLANAFAEAYLVRAAAAGGPDSQTLQILRRAHENLRGEAVRIARSDLHPTAKEWELSWLRVRDEIIARTYSDASLRSLLGGRAVTDARLIEPATPPARPVETVAQQQARAFGGVGGVALFGALVLAFLLEQIDDRVRSEEDAERATGLQVLATLPSRRHTRRALRLFTAEGRKRGALQGLGGPGMSPIPDPRLAQAFQSLRVHVDLAGRERPLRTLLVASPGNGGDKTIVSAFLATALAQAGRRVIVVSADLHRPAIESVFDVAVAPGLGEAAEQDLGLTELACQTWIPNVVVLPAGVMGGHPADVLASARVGRILEQAQAAADVVVIEAPPVLAGAEASILVPNSDAVLLVLESGETTRAHALAAKTALEKVRNGATFLGSVLTNVADGRDVRRRNGRGHRPRRRKP